MKTGHHGQRTHRVKIGFGFVWLLLIFAGYYWGHKPFDLPWVVQSAQFVLPSLTALFFLSTGGLLGFRLLANLKEGSRMVRLVLQIILGCGLLALILLLVGLTLGVSRWISWGVLMLVFGLNSRFLLAWGQQWRDLQPDWTIWQSFDRWLLGLTGALLALSFLTNWLPVHHFDALMYHFMLPKAYLLQGRISDLSWQIQSGMPQNGEMLYLWGLSLLNETTALLIVWLLGVMALLGLAANLKQWFGLRSALVGLASFLSGYTVISSLSWGYVDWVTFIFSSAMLLAFFNWLTHQQIRWLILAGVLAGLLLGSKYTSGAVLVSMEVAITVFCLRTQKSWWKSMLFFNLPLLLFFSPWLIKNLIFTGNPMYPLFFVSGSMTPIRIDTYQSAPPWGNWLDVLLLPFMATFTGFQGADGYGNAIGPLLLTFGGLFWLSWRTFNPGQKMILKTALWMAVTGVVVWMLANQMSGFLVQTRMHYGLFPLFMLLAAAGFWSIRQLDIPEVRLSKIAQGATLLALGLVLIQFSADSTHQRVYARLTGSESAEDILAATLGVYVPAMQAVKALPEETHTLLLYETRSYHCLPQCQPDEILDRWKRDWQIYGDGEAILDAWRSEGITHVLVYQRGIRYVLDNWVTDENRETLQGLQVFLTLLPEPMQTFGTSYKLYDIR
jgi:hypothetical protein